MKISMYRNIKLGLLKDFTWFHLSLVTKFEFHSTTNKFIKESPHGIVANVMDCNTVKEYKL